MNLKYDRSNESKAFNDEATKFGSYVELEPSRELIGDVFRLGMRSHFNGKNTIITEANGNVQTEEGYFFGPKTDHSNNGSEGLVPCQIRNAYVQAASPENVTRHATYAGMSTEHHNRLEMESFGVRGFPIGLNIIGNNYFRGSDFHSHINTIGVLQRNHPFGGGGTDSSLNEFFVSRSNVGMMIMDHASSKNPYGLPMHFQYRDGYINTSDTCHIAMMSVNPLRMNHTEAHFDNVGCEYIHGDDVNGDEGRWNQRAPFVHNTYDIDRDTGLIIPIQKVIPPCSFYVETGSLYWNSPSIGDAKPWVVALLDGPNAAIHMKKAGLGGGQHGYGIMARHKNAKAYVEKSIHYGIYQNLAQWPELFPMYDGHSGNIVFAAGTPTNLRVPASRQYPKQLRPGLSAISPQFKPVDGLKMLKTSAPVAKESPINGGEVRKFSFAADAWDNDSVRMMLTEGAFAPGLTGIGRQQMTCFTMLVKVDCDVPVKLGFDGWSYDYRGHSGKRGETTFYTGEWQRVVVGRITDWHMWPSFWSETKGHAMDISVTDFAPWTFGPGAEDVYSLVIQKGLWVP